LLDENIPLLILDSNEYQNFRKNNNQYTLTSLILVPILIFLVAVSIETHNFIGFNFQLKNRVLSTFLFQDLWNVLRLEIVQEKKAERK
jgi:uncharacterized Tic20 family protein